jgi:hypothetical protein
MAVDVTLRVLLGWELGGGFGHIASLQGIAKRIQESLSCNFLYALRVPENGRKSGIPWNNIIAAPHPKRAPSAEPPKARDSYGEFVSEALMIDEGAFAFRLAGWDKIINDFKPDLIIADYAPGLSLFARGRWPVLAIGNGYTLPPAELEVFPPMTRSKRPVYGSEAEIIDWLNGDLKHAGAKLIERLPQLNEATAYGLRTMPIFDPYQAFRKQDYLGVEIPGGAPMPRLSHSGVIAYFHEKNQLNEEVIAGLGKLEIDTDVYFGMSMRSVKRKFKGSRVTVADAPFALGNDMPGKAVAVHRGGLGFTAAALVAGVPQVVVYEHDEAHFQAKSIRNAGAGLSALLSKITARTFAEAVQHVSASSAMQERAMKLAEAHAHFRNANPAQAVADLAIKLMRSA